MARDNVGFNLDAEVPDIVDFLRDDLFLRKTELGDPVNQNSARFVQRFENRHVVASAREIARARQSCRSCADDGDLAAVRLDIRRRMNAVRTRPVRDKAFDTAD